VLAMRNQVPPLHRVPAHLARRFHQICIGIGDEVTRPFRLSPVEFAMIAAIEDETGLDQRRLAGRLAIDTVSTSKFLDRLESLRLVRRRVNAEDRRARALSLTPRGREVRLKIGVGFRAAHERLMAPLSRDEQTQFIELLVRLVEANEAYARPGNGRRKPVRRREAKESKGNDNGKGGVVA
jgi:MarR family transcriptional regulator, temperature-dependent positive regulator of motility